MSNHEADGLSVWEDGSLRVRVKGLAAYDGAVTSSARLRIPDNRWGVFPSFRCCTVPVGAASSLSSNIPCFHLCWFADDGSGLRKGITQLSMYRG